MSLPIFERLYSDVIKKGGIHTIGTKQTGKSNLKKSLSAYVMQKHPETKLIIIDTEGSWEFEFNKVPFYRIVNKDVKIGEEIIGQKLNGNNFYRKTYKINDSVKQDVNKLLESKKPVLFIVELEEPEEIAYFSSYVIEYLYNRQRIKRKYWKNQLKDSYFIVLEECENIFSSHSLDKSQLNKLRKKYNELANLKIGILSSSQRLTEVDKKFRAKMSGYLIGHILPEDFIGIIQRALKLHMGAEAKKVTEPQFRHSFYYTGLNRSFKIDRFTQDGEPYEVPRTEPKQELKESETLNVKRSVHKPTLKERLKYWWDRLVSFPIPPTIRKPKNQVTYTEDRDESDAPLLAESDEQLNETLFFDEDEPEED